LGGGLQNAVLIQAFLATRTTARGDRGQNFTFYFNKRCKSFISTSVRVRAAVLLALANRGGQH
jgi:hypothetical protein